MWELIAEQNAQCIFRCWFNPQDIAWEDVWVALGRAIRRQPQEPYMLRIRVVSPQGMLTP